MNGATCLRGFEYYYQSDSNNSNGVHNRCIYLYDNGAVPNPTRWALPDGVTNVGTTFVTRTNQMGTGPIAEDVEAGTDSWRCHKFQVRCFLIILVFD